MGARARAGRRIVALHIYSMSPQSSLTIQMWAFQQKDGQCASTFHYLSADLISLDISRNFSITVSVIENKYCNQTNYFFPRAQES